MPTQAKAVTQVDRQLLRGHQTLADENRLSWVTHQIYDWTLTGELNFYRHDPIGYPLPIPSIWERSRPTNPAHVPTLSRSCTFDAAKWATELRNNRFTGTQWPPLTLADILAPNPEEACAVCDLETACSCTHLQLQQTVQRFWNNNIKLEDVGRRGIGAIALHDIPYNTVIGEYTGELIPYVIENESNYLTKIRIGDPMVPGRKVYAHIDAGKTGSVMRFLNHSCDSNAAIIEGRAGMDRRVAIVCSAYDIAAGEEITIDYMWKKKGKGNKGKKRKRDDPDICLCNKKVCKDYPQPDDAPKYSDKKRPKMS